jgi:predicted transcriptional regulator of viral defense system
MQTINKLKRIKKSLFSTAEAHRVGVSARMLSYLVEHGHLERRTHGLYCFSDHPDELDLVDIIGEALRVVPHAIVGLETALQLYDLSDEPTRDVCLIVNQKRAPSRKLPDVRFFRVRTPLSRFATKRIKGLTVTTLEQTMVDLLRSGYPISGVVKLFHDAQQRRIPVELSALKRLGHRFRAKGKVQRVIEAVC